MPGSPNKAKAIAKLDRWGGINELLVRTRAGQTILQIAKELDIHHQILYDYCNRYHKEALREARRDATHFMSEKNMEIADAAKPHTAKVADLQIRTRQWTMERWNRPDYGPSTAVDITQKVSVLHLHLSAVQARPIVAKPLSTPIDALPAPQLIEAAAEEKK